MSTNDTKGVCRFCLKSFSGRSMARHLTSCKVKKEKDFEAAKNKKKKDLIYHIKISGYKIFWLHIEIKGTKKLSALDTFLRNIWLECCGHLSEFTIDGTEYSYLEPEVSESLGGIFALPSKSMKYQIKEVLDVKDTFTYEYDFGSTTHLEGQVVSTREGYLKEPVKILARNNPLELFCKQCEKPATQICLECGYIYCDHCLTEHECGDEMTLPVVNSPRMGVCGYAGEYDFDDFAVTS